MSAKITQPLPFQLAPKCLAKTRRGALCRQPRTAKGRCRLHGGVAGSGAPKGERNYSAESIELRRATRELKRAADGVDWLIWPEGQDVIANYKIDGQQLFFPDAKHG
jgi:hypothetical protein